MNSSNTNSFEPGKGKLIYSPLPGSLPLSPSLDTQDGDSDQPSYYPGLNGDEAYPRVSSILDATMSVKTKAALQNWRKKDSQERKEAKAAGIQMPAPAKVRGTIVHAWREYFLKTGNMPTGDLITEPGVTEEEIRSFFDPLVTAIKLWDPLRHIWCEGPMNDKNPEMNQFFYINEKGLQKARFWSDEYRYAGCPDDLGYYKKINLRTGKIEWRLTLCDLKTSGKLYYSSYPEKGDPEYFLKMTGYQKFDRCCLQLGAYWVMVNEQLGLDPDLMMIIATPGRTQRFTLSHLQKRRAISNWKKKVEQYYESLRQPEVGASVL